MAKPKTKVTNRRKSRKHVPRRRRPAPGYGSGGGGTFGGLRAGFRTLVGRGGGKGKRETTFMTVAMWLVIVGAVLFFVGRYAC